MLVFDLPPEILHTILAKVVEADGEQEGQQLLNSHRNFWQHIGQVYFELASRENKSLTSQIFVPVQDDRTNARCTIQAALLTGRSDGNHILKTLAPSIATLMACPALKFSIDGDTASVSTGYLEDLKTDASRARFLKIVEAMSQMLVVFENINHPRQVGEDDPDSRFPGISSRSCNRYLYAVATTTYMENIAATTALMTEANTTSFLTFQVAHYMLLLWIEGVERLPGTNWSPGVNETSYSFLPVCAVRFCSIGMVKLVLKKWFEMIKSLGGPAIKALARLMMRAMYERGSLQIKEAVLAVLPDIQTGNQLEPAIATRCNCRHNDDSRCGERLETIWPLVKPQEVEILELFVRDCPSGYDISDELLYEAHKNGCATVGNAMIQLCIDLGGPPPDLPGCLGIALRHGHAKVVEGLLQRGVRTGSVFRPSAAIGHFEEDSAHTDMLEYLRLHRSTIHPEGSVLDLEQADFIVYTASVKGYSLTLEYLVWSGYPLLKEGRGAQALRYAVTHKSEKVIRILRRAGVAIESGVDHHEYICGGLSRCPMLRN